MIKRIVGIALALILLAAVCVPIYLNYNGLLSFWHPMKKAKDGQIRVACVGDSVTYGFGIKNRAKYHYPAQLQKMLGDGYCVNNFGYSGRTLSSEGDRPYVNEKLYRQSLDFQPDIVVFMLGSNDSKAFNWKDSKHFADEYVSLINSYRALKSKPRIYVVVPTPVFPVNGEVKYNIDGDVLQNEIVPATRMLGAALGLPVIDMNSVFEGREDLFSDGCHPNREGAELYAKTVAAAIPAAQSDQKG